MAAPLNLNSVEGETLFIDLWRSEEMLYITTRKGYSHRNKKMGVMAGMADTFAPFLCRFARQHSYSILNFSNEIAYISTCRHFGLAEERFHIFDTRRRSRTNRGVRQSPRRHFLYTRWRCRRPSLSANRTSLCMNIRKSLYANRTSVSMHTIAIRLVCGHRKTGKS